MLVLSYSGLIIDIKGMATPIAGAIVLYGFNDAVRSTITIIAVAIASVILAYVISAIINKFNLMNVGFKLPRRKPS